MADASHHFRLADKMQTEHQLSSEHVGTDDRRHMEALMPYATLISTFFSLLRVRFVSVPAGSLWNGAFTQNS